MGMVAGGVTGRHGHEATDKNGIAAVKDKMQINELRATMLYLLGLDRE
jgi:hypothetical protein